MRLPATIRQWATPLALLILLFVGSIQMPAVAAATALDVHPAKVDLNRADQVELESLPGIGPHLAMLILEYREKLGSFQRIEDLMNVRGIGERKFLQLQDLIKVDGPAPGR